MFYNLGFFTILKVEMDVSMYWVNRIVSYHVLGRYLSNNEVAFCFCRQIS